MARGVIAKVITFPQGAAWRSRGLRVIRGHASFGKMPGPFASQFASSARTATAK